MATAQWRKVIVSGSSANLSNLQVDGLTSGQVVIGGGSGSNLSTTAINGTGNILATTGATGVAISGAFSGSFTGAITTSLSNASQPYYVAYNTASGTLSYAGTGSFTAATASYVTSSNVYGPYGSNSILSASYASGSTSASYASTATSASYASNATSASYALNATSASYALNATSASYALSASYATSASYAISTSVAISSSYALSASYAPTAGSTIAALTQGTGITAFTYSGSVAQTVAVSGASSLSTNYITKWTGAAFANSSITDNGTTVSVGGGNFTVTTATGDTTIAGNLTVNGTASFINTQNLYVKDAFIVVASGSTTATDGGFIVQYNTGSGTNGSGSAFYLRNSGGVYGNYGRFAVAYDQTGSVTNVTPDQYVVTVSSSAGSPTGNPVWGGATYGFGNMYVNSSTSDIYIYA